MLRSLKLAAVIVAALCVLGCSGSPKTEITGANARADDHIEREGKSGDQSRTTEISVSPTTRPSTADVIRRLIVGPHASETAQPTPVDIEVDRTPPVQITLPTGQSIVAPQGSAVTVRVHEAGITNPERYVHSRYAVGQGATLKTDNAQGATGFNASAPEAKLGRIPGESGSASSDGGESAFSFVENMLSSSSKLSMTFGIAAIGLVLAGVAILILPKFISGLVLDSGAAYVCFVMALFCTLTAVVVDKYPWIMALSFVGVIIVAAWYGYQKYIVSQKDKALTTIVKGVENADADAAAKVKESISDEGGSAADVKSVISAAKDAAGV